MRGLVALFLLAAALLSACAPPPVFDYEVPGSEEGESDVLALRTKDFDKTVKAYKHVLVEFYAPWCGHCKALAPEYAAAAKELKARLPSVVLANVDGTVETALPQRYGAKGFPHLVWFADGSPSEYTGGRTRAEIISWVSAKARPALAQLASVAEADAFRPAPPYSFALVAYAPRSAQQASLLALLESTARASSLTVGWTEEADVAASLGLPVSGPPAAVALLRAFDEEPATVHLEGPVTGEALVRLLASHSRPLLLPFNAASAPTIFAAAAQVLCIAPPGGAQLPGLGAAMRAAAAASRATGAQFVLVDSGEAEASQVLEFFGVGPPALAGPVCRGFLAHPTAAKFAFPPFEGLPGVEELSAFALAVAGGTAPPHYKSAPAPPPGEAAGPVLRVRGETFAELVLDPGHDVLLMVYAPWCGHCKALEPVYEKLARRFAAAPSVRIASMDGTANEHPLAPVTGFPTLFFYPAAPGAEKRGEAVAFDGERTLQGMTKWLRAHAAVPFRLPTKAEGAAAAAAAAERHAHGELRHRRRALAGVGAERL